MKKLSKSQTFKIFRDFVVEQLDEQFDMRNRHKSFGDGKFLKFFDSLVKDSIEEYGIWFEPKLVDEDDNYIEYYLLHVSETSNSTQPANVRLVWDKFGDGQVECIEKTDGAPKREYDDDIDILTNVVVDIATQLFEFQLSEFSYNFKIR